VYTGEQHTDREMVDILNSSTSNTYPQQPLPHMNGPLVEIHLKEDAKAVHTPSKIPIHWQDQVQKEFPHNKALGVIGKVPCGEPLLWCHRMVVTRKHDSSLCRTIDLSCKHCKRE